METLSGDGWWLLHADCREAFLSLPAKSVHCIVTSPPYWGGVRDYGIAPVTWADGWEGCYGNEPTVEAYVAHTLEVFAALGHALRDDGTIWWNIGDCYCTGAGSAKSPGGGPRGENWQGAASQPSRMPQTIRAGNKSLVPFRVALALQEAGWIIRQDNIWLKPSPMPESIDGWRWEPCRVKVSGTGWQPGTHPSQSGAAISQGKTRTGFAPYGSHGGMVESPMAAKWIPCPGCDKCRYNGGMILRRGSWRSTTAHEFVFQITKGPEYFSDAAAASEVATYTGHQRSEARGAFSGSKGTPLPGREPFRAIQETRNPRSVWTISSEAYKGKHFAAFPTMLAWKCIQASTSAGGCCAACGSQYAPIVEKSFMPQADVCESKRQKGSNKGMDATNGLAETPRGTVCKRTIGYRATCDCNAGDPVPCRVGDPFTGSGTVLQVAINTGRQFVGSEIAAHYLPLIQERAETPWAPKTEKKPAAKRRKKRKRDQLLFN